MTGSNPSELDAAIERLRASNKLVEEARGKRWVIIHRADGWYPLELPLADDLNKHAEANPGTLKITHLATHDVLWSLQ